MRLALECLNIVVGVQPVPGTWVLHCFLNCFLPSSHHGLLHPVSLRYANVKKCSNEGRALMQLDFQQFLMKLEKLTDIRPIPDKEFVETYIKAYYLTENDMERWIKEHRVRMGVGVLLLSGVVCDSES